MKRFASLLLLLFANFIAVRGYAQSHTFTHVVIILQKNRTPDNIFGSTPTFLPGVDVVGNGYIATCAAQTPRQVPMMQNSDGLVTCYDLGHGHTSWNSMCDLPSGGTQCKMDNACLVALGLSGCSNGYHPPQDPQYQYLPYDVAQPYFAIATNYGFANYMFQTNQGPSFPAHQFIISGTSAPAAPGQNYANYFASENPKPSNQKSGCPAPSGEYVLDINPQGNEDKYFNNGFPCYQHPALTDQLAYFPSESLNWKYYAPTGGSLWTAPNALQGLCYANGRTSGPCNGQAWQAGSSMVLEGGTNGVTNLAPIFNDIANCQLANVNWVIPDGRWSDHAGKGILGNLGLGPAYVASIINAIGADKKCDNGGYWNDTVILVTWDDWGGWFDHVPPFKVVNDGTSWGSGYAYGFRVPLLVVSGWTPKGYVDGALPGGRTSATTHDFGSILSFVELNFGLSPIAPPGFAYADSNAPDNPHPLAGFFGSPTFRQFQQLPLSGMYAGFSPSYFQTYTDGSGPADPDLDAAEDLD